MNDDLLDRIDDVLDACGWCSGPLGGSPSGAFCREWCQRQWTAERVGAEPTAMDEWEYEPWPFALDDVRVPTREELNATMVELYERMVAPRLRAAPRPLMTRGLSVDNIVIDELNWTATADVTYYGPDSPSVILDQLARARERRDVQFTWLDIDSAPIEALGEWQWDPADPVQSPPSAGGGHAFPNPASFRDPFIARPSSLTVERPLVPGWHGGPQHGRTAAQERALAEARARGEDVVVFRHGAHEAATFRIEQPRERSTAEVQREELLDEAFVTHVAALDAAIADHLCQSDARRLAPRTGPPLPGMDGRRRRRGGR